MDYPNEISNLTMKDRYDSERYLSIMAEIYQRLDSFQSLVKAHKSFLGKQDYCWTDSEFRFWVWERPQYRLMVNNKKGIEITLPAGTSRDQAFDALEQYRQDMGISSSLLPGSEAARLEREGRKAIKGRELEIKSYTKKRLREFVLEYCAGKIWTDRHYGKDVGMAFFPISFGGIQPPDEILDEIRDLLPSDPGKKPEMPDPPQPPQRPDMPETPDMPRPPPPIQEDPEVIENIRHKMKWQIASEEDLEQYRAKIARKNEEQNQQYQETLAEWEIQCVSIWMDQETIEQKHQEAMASWETTAKARYESECERVKAQIQQWQVDKERYEIAYEGLYKQFTIHLGLIWEHAEQALPMGVNGKPCFLSCHLMNKEDLEKALTAIEKEQKRRAELEI